MSSMDWQLCLKEKDASLEGFEPQSKVELQMRCDLHLNHQATDFSCTGEGHLLEILLFYVTGGKQKDKVLLDFQGTKSLRKMFILSVGRCGKKYLCKVSTLRLHKKNHRANFQTQHPLHERFRQSLRKVKGDNWR